jgi:phosphosulfolactate phosphohydrolase-like enzyme
MSRQIGRVEVQRTRSVSIDALPDSALRHSECDAVVCIDILLASTTIVTSLALGRAAFPAATREDAVAQGRLLRDPLLALEPGSAELRGFEPQMGPAKLAARSDTARPLVLISPLATLVANAAAGATVYIASFRNLNATVEALARHQRVALLGVGHGAEQRCEDRIFAARLAQALIGESFEPADLTTVQEISSWSASSMSLVALGKSAEYLRRQGRAEEIDFVLGHNDDLDIVCVQEDGEAMVVDGSERIASQRPGKIVGFSRGTVLAFGKAST